MGVDEEPKTQEIPVVRAEKDLLLRLKPSADDTPIYDELMEYYVRYFGWDESRPFGVVWVNLHHPEVPSEDQPPAGSDEGVHDSDERGDGGGHRDTREFAVVSTDRLTVADADAIAESLMHDLPAAALSPPVPPPAASESKPSPARVPANKRTRMANAPGKGRK